MVSVNLSPRKLDQAAKSGIASHRFDEIILYEEKPLRLVYPLRTEEHYCTTFKTGPVQVGLRARYGFLCCRFMVLQSEGALKYLKGGVE